MRRRRSRLRTTTRRWRAARGVRDAPSPRTISGGASRSSRRDPPRSVLGVSAATTSFAQASATPSGADPSDDSSSSLARRADETRASPPPRPPGVARTRAGARRDARGGYRRAGTRAGRGARGRDATRGRPRATLREGTGVGRRWRQRESRGGATVVLRTGTVREVDGVGRRAGSGRTERVVAVVEYPISHGVTSPRGGVRFDHHVAVAPA